MIKSNGPWFFWKIVMMEDTYYYKSTWKLREYVYVFKPSEGKWKECATKTEYMKQITEDELLIGILQ